jgi:hypothetical protein
LIRILLLLAEGPHTQSELARICKVNNVTMANSKTKLSPLSSVGARCL